MACTLPSCCVALCICCVVLCIVYFVTFPVLFVCICVLNNCHRVATQLQLNISYRIINTKVIPVITVATGTISKSVRQYLGNIQGKHEIKELQNTAILGTAHCGKC